jgi:hypothetical protein
VLQFGALRFCATALALDGAAFASLDLAGVAVASFAAWWMRPCWPRPWAWQCWPWRSSRRPARQQAAYRLSSRCLRQALRVSPQRVSPWPGWTLLRIARVHRARRRAGRYASRHGHASSPAQRMSSHWRCAAGCSHGRPACRARRPQWCRGWHSRRGRTRHRASPRHICASTSSSPAASDGRRHWASENPCGPRRSPSCRPRHRWS